MTRISRHHLTAMQRVFEMSIGLSEFTSGRRRHPLINSGYVRSGKRVYMFVEEYIKYTICCGDFSSVPLTLSRLLL